MGCIDRVRQTNKHRIRVNFLFDVNITVAHCGLSAVGALDHPALCSRSHVYDMLTHSTLDKQALP